MDVARKTDLEWRTTSTCSSSSACVECAALPDGGMALRDGKDRQGPVLKFSAVEWAEFTAGVRNGEFDLAVDDQPPTERS
jgi:Domain of unknown function (DUF397)